MDHRDAGRAAPGTGAGARRRDGGFTLVEMLIALVITGILAGGVITLLMGQNRFYGSTDEAVYAEQSLRATSDLLASELRMINPGSSGSETDIKTAEAQQLTFRLDTHRFVVCHENSGEIWAFRFSKTSAPNVDGGKGYALRSPSSGSAWAWDTSWDPMANESQATSQSSSIAVTCDDNGGPTVTSANYHRYYKWDSWGGSPTPEDGDVIRAFGEVTYEFKSSNFGSGTAVFRNDQELAGPFEAGAGFSYVMDGGGVQTSVSSSDIPNIRRIRINATAVGSGDTRYDVTRDLQFDIPLRN